LVKYKLAFVQKFEKSAEEIKADETWRKSYMQTEVRIQDKIDARLEKVAKSLLTSDMPVEDVAKHSGLSIDVIERLKSEVILEE